MPYSAPDGCVNSPAQWNDMLHTQESLIREQIMQDFAKERPYVNTIAGDTWNWSGAGEDIRTLVQNRVATAWSRTIPQFDRATTLCNGRPEKDQIGQTEYVTRMETLMGESPDVCVRQAVHGVMGSLNAAYDAMKTACGELIDYDVRAQYLIRSGAKYVANSTLSRDLRFSGGRKVVGAEFNTTVAPDSPMTYKGLINLIQYSKNVLGSKLFGSGVDQHALVIAGFEQVEKFRNEALVNSAILAQTQGGYADGNNAIKAYQWTDIQHRGARLGVDDEPLRFNDWGPEGLPDLISPTVTVASDTGVDAAPNPDWLSAQYEVGFVVFQDAFKRVVPSRYTGEGQWKFAPQFTMGELTWHNVKDNNCNIRGDTGFFYYEVTRAIQAWNPHNVVAFAYKRCALDDDLEPCEGPAISS